MKTISALLVLFLEPFLYGFVLVKLWSWFVAPTFHVPNLNIPVALGISLVVGMLTHQFVKTKEKVEYETADFLGAVLRPLLYLGIGAIYHAFM